MSNASSLRLDPYLASSLFQKSVRRGETDFAIAAIDELFRHRGRSAWNRLLVVAFEDIGLGDPALVQRLVEAAGQTEPYLDLDDIRYFTGELAGAPKCRAADHLFSAASLQMKRLPIGAEWSTAEFIATAADPSLPIVERAIALLHPPTAGQHLPLWRLAERLNALTPFLSAEAQRWSEPSQAALKKLRHPFVALLPLLATARAEDGLASQVIEEPLPSQPLVEGVPCFAFDKHTWLGKRAIAQFGKSNEDVAGVLDAHVPPCDHAAVLEMGAFHVDAAPVDRALLWSRSEELKNGGVRADMQLAGCPPFGVGPILDAVSRNLDHLNAIRQALHGRTGR